MTELMDLASLKNQALSPKKVKSALNKLAIKNKKDLSFKDVPEYMRTPTADELIEMRQWAIDYKKFHTTASKREVRKATQEHFKIRIFR